jgi:hypothetical protein
MSTKPKLLPLILLISCLPCVALHAQGDPDSTLYFSFLPPKTKPVRSLYRSIDFLDARQDTSMIGVLGVTDKGGVARLVLATPVLPQLTNVLNTLTKGPAGDGRLLFQLKRFSFAERTRARYCYLSAVLYAQTDGRFLQLSSLDTTLVIAASFVRGELEKKASEMLGSFIAHSIILRPAAGAPACDTAGLAGIDSIRKRQIPAYNTSSYTEGFYSDYTAFMHQTPDLKGDVRTKQDGTVSSFKVHGEKWRGDQERHIFAFVYRGAPYIVTHFGFYPLEKKDDDFYFTGKLRVAPTSGEKTGTVLIGALAAGVTGAVLADALTTERALYRVLIDYATGEFIHLAVINSNSKSATP